MKNANKLSLALIASIMLFTGHISLGQEKNVNDNDYVAPSRTLTQPDNKVESSLSIGFYPNPCKDVLTIELENHESFKDEIINIYSLTGTRVWNGTISQKKTINVSDLNPGFYILNCNGASYKFQKA